MLYTYLLTVVKLLIIGAYCPSAAFPSNGPTGSGGDVGADRARIVGIRATIPTDDIRVLRANYDFIVHEYNGQRIVRQSFASPTGIFLGDNLYKAVSIIIFLITLITCFLVIKHLTFCSRSISQYELIRLIIFQI